VEWFSDKAGKGRTDNTGLGMLARSEKLAKGGWGEGKKRWENHLAEWEEEAV